jgi:hypothetical protein
LPTEKTKLQSRPGFDQRVTSKKTNCQNELQSFSKFAHTAALFNALSSSLRVKVLVEEGVMPPWERKSKVGSVLRLTFISLLKEDAKFSTYLEELLNSEEEIHSL